MAFDWKTDAQGKKYRVAARQRGYFHVYQNGAVKKLGGPRPTGFNQFNEKNRSYYKNVDDGVTSSHVYQNGRKVNMGGGSIFKADPGLAPFYKQGMASSELKYGVPQKTLETQMGRERGSQNQAYGQIANYYAGMAGNAKGLMDQAGQVGQQTDASLKSIGADRNLQIQAATPQYAGPLGAVAQNMANSEQQAALNRGAAVDQSNRAMNTMTSGNRQAHLGEIGAGQQVAGQERLSTLKGQGQQALNVYADKIAELERQKALGAVDSAQQLRSAQQQYGLDQQKLDQTAADNVTQNGIAQQNADANTTRANQPPKSSSGGKTRFGSTPAKQQSFNTQLDNALGLSQSQIGLIKPLSDSDAADTISRNFNVSFLQGQIVAEKIKYGHVRKSTLVKARRNGFDVPRTYWG
jgi:hypothetical protein